LYNHHMRKNVIHISESEAASDFALVMTRVREGAEVIIERDTKPVAVVRPAEAMHGRPISESIALAETHAKELGYEPTMDADFAADLEEIIKSRKPRNTSTWE
jgi:antitoxin (DNA-binding transcriptional repressor) of toxin-antitoxin stability system